MDKRKMQLFSLKPANITYYSYKLTYNTAY